MKRVIPMVAVVFACGCGGSLSLEAKTAGQVGCLPSEITVSNVESESGWSQGAQTWTAECHGEHFVCSEVQTSNSKGGATSQITCHAQGGTQENTLAPANSTGQRAPGTPQEAPKTAAGFTLGASAQDLKTECEHAGKAWTADESKAQSTDDSLARCSGTAIEMGFPAQVEITFVAGRSTSITIVQVPDGGWVGRMATLRGTLVKKYGEEQQRKVELPKECQTDAAFVDCLKTKTATMQYVWSWKSGHKILLAAGRRRGTEDQPVILLRYTTPAAGAVTGAGL